MDAETDMSRSTSSHRPRFDGRTAFWLAAVAVVAAPVVLFVSMGLALGAGFCSDSDSDTARCPSTATVVGVFVIGSILVLVPFVIGFGRLVADVVGGGGPDHVCHDRRVNRKAVVAVVSTLAVAVTGALTRATVDWMLALVLVVAPLALFAVVHALRAITEVREAGAGARGGTAARWSLAVTVVSMVVLVLLPV